VLAAARVTSMSPVELRPAAAASQHVEAMVQRRRESSGALQCGPK